MVMMNSTVPMPGWISPPAHPRTPQAALGRLYFGQLVKVIVTVGLFVLAFYVLPHVVWPALLVAYLATLVVSWSGPLRVIRRGSGRG